jgi:hypothetical protein
MEQEEKTKLAEQIKIVEKIFLNSHRHKIKL